MCHFDLVIYVLLQCFALVVDTTLCCLTALFSLQIIKYVGIHSSQKISCWGNICMRKFKGEPEPIAEKCQNVNCTLPEYLLIFAQKIWYIVFCNGITGYLHVFKLETLFFVCSVNEIRFYKEYSDSSDNCGESNTFSFLFLINIWPWSLQFLSTRTKAT